MSSCKLAVDIMGGDQAPQSTSKAVLSIAGLVPEVQFYVVGLPHVLSQYFTARPANIHLVPVEASIEMGMTTAQATSLGATSSMGRMLEMLKAKEVDIALSAGSTAALMSLSYLTLKMQPNVRRPSIVSSLFYKGKRKYITDLGANIAPKASDLLANAQVALNEISRDHPSVALLNVGKEDSKGTPLLKEASELFKASEMNYVGFVEGGDIITSDVDLIVCDGFVGNCVTKLLESLIAVTELHVSSPSVLPSVHHAALLAGLNGLVFKAHGSSSTQDFAQAIRDVLSYKIIPITI